MTHTRRLVLLVDDIPENLGALTGILKDEYRTKVSTSGAKALTLARSETDRPDVILLDVMMPEMDGHEVCRILKSDPATRDIPVIFVTGKTDAEEEVEGLSLGAVDYIHKPFHPVVVKARLKNQLAIKDAQDFLRQENEILDGRVAERTRQIAAIQDATLVAMGTLAEIRDPETGNHIYRTQKYVARLCELLADHPRFRAQLTPEMVQIIVKTTPLHDIGKVGIPDHVLLKPGPLDAVEFATMKTHTLLGRGALRLAQKDAGFPLEFLKTAEEIAYSHHEKWDGTGYPEGMKGEAIPLSARLMALADVYDALVSKRVYKEGLSHQEAVEIIAKGSGSHFDPDLVEAFLLHHQDFDEIARLAVY